jgi:hypothetical protein
MLKRHANFNGCSKHCGVGIFTVMKLLKSLVSSEIMNMLAFARNSVRTLRHIYSTL